MIDFGGAEGRRLAGTQYEVYEFYKWRQRGSSTPGWTTTGIYTLKELSEGGIYTIGIPSVSSFGEHVSTGACCRVQ